MATTVKRLKPSVNVDFAFYVDGKGQLGLVREAEVPEFEVKTEEWIAGGMAGTVEINMASLSVMLYKLTFGELNVATLATFGLSNGGEKSFVIRMATRNDAIGSLVYKFTGSVNKFKTGKIEREKIATTEFEVKAIKSQILINGKEVFYADFVAGDHRVNGVDQRAEINKAIGATAGAAT